MNIQPQWIVDKTMVEKNNFPLLQIFQEEKVDCFFLEVHPRFNTEDILKLIPYSSKDLVIPYVSLNVSRHLKQFYGMFYQEQDFLFHHYSSILVNAPLLNNDFVLTTFIDFKQHIHKYRKIFGNKIFIRPNSGHKTFTGLVITLENFEHETNSLQQLTSVMNNTIIVVAKAKEVFEEYRFVICDQKVVDGSLYMKEGNSFEENTFPEEAKELAQIVGQIKELPPVFTCDIGKTNEGFKIIELNSFNCAGWYACSPQKIIKSVNEYAQKAYQEDFLD